jgi:hypothetical protein
MIGESKAPAWLRCFEERSVTTCRPRNEISNKKCVVVAAIAFIHDHVHAHFARDVLLCSFRKLSLMLSLTLTLISLETFLLLETVSLAHFSRNALTARGVFISSYYTHFTCATVLTTAPDTQ